MAYVTYTAKREIEPTGFSKTGTDLSSIGSDDSFDAATTNLSGLLVDQWLQAAGFVKNAGWFQVKSNSTSAKILTNTPPVTHLRLPGLAGNYASTPDTAANSITGDIDLRVRVSMVRWTAFTSTLLAKNTSSGNQRAYYFSVNLDGSLRLIWTPDGTSASQINKQSTVTTGIVDGAVKWVRVTLKVNNGAAGNDVKFYTSDDGIIWTQLGATVTTAGTTSIFDSTAILSVGAYDGTVEPANGRFYYAEVRNGIDGPVVAAFDPSRGTRGAGSLVALTGETWTINTSGTPPALLQGPLLTYEGADYLNLPGITGNYASTPDSAAVSITSDIDIRVRIAPDDWTPAANTAIVSKNSGVSQTSYQFLVTPGGLQLAWTENGTTLKFANSTSAVGAADGSIKWIRATLDVNNGAAGRDIKFFTSDDYNPVTGAGTWTQLGTTVTQATATSIFDGTSVLEIGSGNGGTAGFWSGKVYYAEVASGLVIGSPVVAIFDPVRGGAGASSMGSFTGETWTINTSGSPAAALVRTTPITITGYKRGFGQSYNLEFKAEQVDRKVKFNRNEQRPIGGGAAEVLFRFSDPTVDVLTEILSESSQVPQFREFLASVAGGEVFTIDRYGTVAAPVDPRQAQLESVGYDEKRVMTTMQQRIAFTVRLLS